MSPRLAMRLALVSALSASKALSRNVRFTPAFVAASFTDLSTSAMNGNWLPKLAYAMFLPVQLNPALAEGDDVAGADDGGAEADGLGVAAPEHAARTTVIAPIPARNQN